MQNPALHPPLEGDALNNTAAYRRDYAASLENSEAFWAKESARLDWMTPWDEVVDAQFTPPVSIRWFSGGMLNVSANCLDRHLAARPEKTAILWEGDDAAEVRRITYRELHADVCRFANVLKSLNVQNGDRVTIYMPMIPEAAVAMLACTRIGAVHSVVFGGFSAEALQNRIVDCGSNLLITADEGRRGGKSIPLKANADRALASLPNVKDVIVIRRTGGKIEWEPSRDRWYDTLMAQASPDCAPEPLASEDPLFLLYTSGSTGKPKGVLHTTAGYLLYAAFTHQAVFDLREEDVYWCTADIGWVTGHSYVLYGPLANGATTLMFEGVPNYPDASRFWQIIDRHKVSSFYTAPTAIRALMREGEAFVKASSRASLRILGSVGEPINPEAWRWFHEKVGERRCPIMDTWWQTETGGILITPLPHATPLKPGSATWPFYGVEPVLLNDAGRPLEGEGEGVLCIKRSWPGQARSIYGDHARFEATYFMPYPGYYFSGDGCRRDADGYYWITGRVDDVINVSGHRLGTAEIESALVAHSQVAEAAVVGMPHAIKGQGIYAFVSLNANATSSPELEKELKNWVRSQIGAIASPDLLQFASALPKTRSGKIMRRLLRKIAEGAVNDLGDVSTLADPETVNELINSRLTPTGN